MGLKRGLSLNNTAGIAETVFSKFKRLLGEYCPSKTSINIVKELIAKAYIYNDHKPIRNP